MITLTRKKLSLELSDDTIPSQGSSDVPIQFINDSNTYQNYIIECRVGWYENFKMKCAIAQYDNGIIKLPKQAFMYNGMIVIVIALIDNQDSNHIEVTQKVSPRVCSAPLGDVQLPKTEIWQTAVKNLVIQLNEQLTIEVNKSLENSLQAINKANEINKKIQQQINEGSFIPNIIATATVNDKTGIPSVTVTKSGTNENPSFDFSFQNLKGEKGDKGQRGVQGVQGNPGQNGADGSDGKSAYQLAVDNGYKGTEKEWLDSLRYDHSEEFSLLVKTVEVKATEAEKAAQSAKEAEQSAIQGASSALEGAESASQSAQSASESATSALESAESAKESAGSALQGAESAEEAKQHAINAQSSAIKAKEEADRAEQATDGKVDKNQGIENKGKVLSVDEQGNVIPTEFKNGSDNVLINSVLKQENPTIEDSYETEMRDLKFYGKSTQVQETGIVPTPERHIPIISKKIKVNDELVELRSLKETSNLIDLQYNLLTYVKTSNNITNTGKEIIITNSYAETGIKFKFNLVKGKKYYFSAKFEKERIDGIEEIVGQTSNKIAFLFNNVPTKTFANGSYFEPTESGEYYLYFYGLSGYKVTYSKIMFVEGKLPYSYIQPTVRDYKIVDHVNKVSKIVRNVAVLTRNFNSSSHQQNENFISFILYNEYGHNPIRDKIGFSNLFKSVHWNGILNEEYFWYSEESMEVVLSKSRNITTTQEVNNFLLENNAEFIVSRKQPIEETIPYLETDSSDYGVSYQDTTTPSPTIPSEVTSIKTIDCTVCGKNLVDIEKIDSTTNEAEFYVLFHKNVVISCEEIPSKISKDIWRFRFNYRNGEVRYIMDTTIRNQKFENVPITAENPITSIFYRGTYIESGKYAGIMVEYGDKTSYEPYKLQHIQLTPPQQFYSILNESIADEVDVVSGVYRYNLKKVIFNLDDVTNVNKINTTSSGFNNFNFKFKNAIVSDRKINTAIECSSFKGILGAWYTDKVFVISGDNSTKDIFYFNVPNEIKTVDQAKELLKNDMELIYVLETPTEIPIPQETLEQLRKLKTFTGVTNIICNTPVSFEYEQSIKIVIDNIMKQLQKQSNTLSNVEREVVNNV